MIPADAQLRALKRDGSSNVPPSATIPPGLAPPDNSRAQGQQGKENRRAARRKAAQDGGNTENEIHEGTAEFRCRGACRHERVWQPQRVCRYQHVRQHAARRRLHHLRRLRPSRCEVLTNPFQRELAGEFARCAASSRAYCSVSIESTFLSRRIALILGKRSASPLAWRELG